MEINTGIKILMFNILMFIFMNVKLKKMCHNTKYYQNYKKL